MEFTQPLSGLWFKPVDRDGHLILITRVHEISPHFDSFKGTEVDRADFDFVDLDDPNPGLNTHVSDCHPGIVRKLVSALRGGGAVLGRVGKVPTDKGNPAWVLGPYDEAGTDAQRATAWIEHSARPPAPAQPATAPPPAPAATPAVATPPPPAAAPAPTRAIDVTSLTEEQRAKLAALGIS